MTNTKTFSGKELEDPEKPVKRFKLIVVSKKLPADAVQNLNARFGYFAETLSDAASEWFDALDLATFQTIDPLYLAFQTRFAFNVMDQWKKKQVFRQTK